MTDYRVIFASGGIVPDPKRFVLQPGEDLIPLATIWPWLRPDPPAFPRRRLFSWWRQ